MAAPSLSTVSESLKSLGQAFENFRKSSGKQKCHYPDTLKSRAVAAIAGQTTIAVVATECGVSKQSLQIWTRAIPPPARRLSVVSQKETVSAFASRSLKSPIEEEKFVFRISKSVCVEATGTQALWLIRELGGEN